MLRANPRVLGSALFSALGLLPLACGGAFNGQDGENGGSASGGTGSGSAGTHTGTSGKSTSGGSSSSAGSDSGTGGTSHAGTSSGGTSNGGTGSGGETSGGTGNAGAANNFPCESPKEYSAGYEQCDNGSLHRREIKECPSKLPRPSDAKIVPPVEGQCTSDADCADMPHGYCSSGGQLPGTFCAYGCVKDSECGAGNICLCGDPVGRCVSASCTSDQDCGAGLRCQSYDQSHGCDILRFSCQSPQDECGGDADCAGGICDGSSGTFVCSTFGCAVGRPFLVQGLSRVAPLAARSDWADALAELDLVDSTTEQRQSIARAWARIGQMEHASVAAFARFALQLLQLGAPPQLVELATQAMADETRHARLAFGIASRYAGVACGPGALDVERSLDVSSLVEVVRLVVLEGCIGETCAALEAREAALHAASPVLASLLGSVADDEARHAELAWRFVSWALERAPLEVAALLEHELAVAPAGVMGPVSADEQVLLAHGVVHDELRAKLRNAALEQVVRPCGAALLARSRWCAANNPVLSA
jgi:hypothetical protein